jgi:PPOX class probable F420-dependent enzyme
MLDTSTEWGRSAAALLAREPVIWLTTIRADGSPWPNPVWFVWDGEGILIYSTPDAAKLRHLRRDPRVTLNLNGEGWANDVVVVSGRAVEAPEEPRADLQPAYVKKYRDGIARLGMTHEEYGDRFSVPVRIEVTAVRGH